ncbi:MAG: NifU family protein [Flavobacteriaceae bacterium]|jgi:Fe-S cluster biogenesis protein NfuA|nr:NifU family protein [Bacteroidota bacterium]MDC0956848.1 NifU family protein [Flavobacteriaceae bacterium]MDG1379320.1 NifU family protein [Flavobacteriaceae bacterium]MDG2350356.1 NifU family protein [Flavobacteriaceae bacterium]|tara:strand:- start:12667 stop:13569 length:903 start_codon:yes stop_codon:yes gene_type:complete
MRKISVSIQQTNNPAILKFESNTFLTQYQSFEFDNIDDAKDSAIAQQLFYLPFVKKIYISGNFIAIERYDIVNWADVQEEVREQIENYLNDGGSIISAEVSDHKIPVTVYAESTPNPAVIKFVANKNLVPAMFEFTSIDDTKSSPFAAKLFHFPFVKQVFIDKNYVSITKFDIADWNDITMELREFIKIYIENGSPIITSDAPELTQQTEQAKEAHFENLDDISKEIINILEEYVKPAVASDGGNIQFESYDAATKNVKVILQGACSGCPSSTFTLKNGIENMLKEMLKDKIESVEAVNG